MARTSTFELVTDTGHFTPLQLQPRALLSLAFNAMSVWLKDNLVSFPDLIKEHRCSVVILGVDLDYQTPVQFFDTDTLSIQASMRVLRGGTRAELQVTFDAKPGRAASVRILLCPVEVLDPVSLGATPAKFPAPILEKFAADEVDPSSPKRRLPELKASIEQDGRPVASFTSAFTVYRHLCEVADQWAFYEVPALVSASREELVLTRGENLPPLLRTAVGSPMRRFSMELSRPYFWFQPGKVNTVAYALGERLALIHQLLSPVPGEEIHGLAIEEF